MLSARDSAPGVRKDSVKFTNANRDGPTDGSRRKSVKYTRKYVMSALETLGIEESDDEVQECRSPGSLKKIDLQPVITTLRAIGNINDYRSSKEADSKPMPYSLDFILTTLEALGENDGDDDEEDEDWDYDLSGGLNEKQFISKIELEGIVSSLTAFERENSKNDLEMLLTETEAKDGAEAAVSKGKDFDLQYVVNSLHGLGEDEEEAQSYLQSLNPARKNSLVKCNLQYVLALLRGLGEPDDEENRSLKACSEKKCASPSSKSWRSSAKDDESYNNSSNNSNTNSNNNSNRNSGKYSGNNSNFNSNNNSGKNISIKNKSCKTEKKIDYSNDSNNSNNSDNDDKNWQGSIKQTVGSH